MEQFFSDTAAAVAAAVIVALTVWLANRIRNYRLEAKLMNALPTNGVGVSYDQFGRPIDLTVQLSNKSSAMIRVRKLVIVTDSFPISFHPDGSVAKSQNPLDNEIRAEKFPRRVIIRGSIPDDEVAGSMIIPPLCLGIWKTDSSFPMNREIVASHAFIVFEYPNLLGQSTLVRIRVEGKKFALVKERVESTNNNALHGIVDPMIADAAGLPVRG